MFKDNSSKVARGGAAVLAPGSGHGSSPLSLSLVPLPLSGFRSSAFPTSPKIIFGTYVFYRTLAV